MKRIESIKLAILFTLVITAVLIVKAFTPAYVWCS